MTSVGPCYRDHLHLFMVTLFSSASTSMSTSWSLAHSRARCRSRLVCFLWRSISRNCSRVRRCLGARHNARNIGMFVEPLTFRLPSLSVRTMISSCSTSIVAVSSSLRFPRVVFSGGGVLSEAEGRSSDMSCSQFRGRSLSCSNGTRVVTELQLAGDRPGSGDQNPHTEELNSHSCKPNSAISRSRSARDCSVPDVSEFERTGV